MGLIEQYIGEIRGLCVRAQRGDNVESEIDETIDRIYEHFQIIQSDSPSKENMEAFCGRLHITRDLNESNPTISKAAFEYALSKCREKSGVVKE